ncbi:MAG: hypothetical protein J5661_01165 [Bacteroidaceae bacterium]|nr:hypothetical protein [Bacteroidaceae bacterium]
MIKYTYVLPAESFSSTLYLKFEFYGGSGNSFAYFDDLEITAGMPTVSLNSFGYATYASDMAIDFTNSEGYTAWQITGVSGETINFQKITGAVAGCTGMLLMGDPSSDVKITLANSGETLSDNLLVGSTENKPLAITGGGNYYGLVGKEFVEVSRGNGTLPAGKAVLPADAVKGSVKSLNLVFNDETGIREVRTVSVEEAAEIFNLAGQRLQKAQKGVNIVNGKKVLIQR